ncbi:MAG: hypothetical protein HUJ93_04915, partial [Bacteroidales bacterium]|nr:hypothetical protein [Bacteroidales bacterium]
DGKIRVDEITAAAKWLTAVVKESDMLLKGEDFIALDAINGESEEGQEALSAAKVVLADVNADASVVSMSDLDACATAFEAKCKAAAEAAAEKAAAEVCPYGDTTDKAIAAFDALKSKVADYFMRCKLISFDAECAASVDVPVAKIGEISAENFASNSDKIAEFPIARPSAAALLPLGTGINPAWQGVMADAKAAALDKEFPGAESVTEEQWNVVAAKLDAYCAAKASLLTGHTEALDKEGADKKEAIATTEKLLHLYRDFYRLLQNYVVLSDFYAPDKKSIFEAGRLYIDQRCCNLCIKVSDMGKHGNMAQQSGMFLIYCACTAKNGGATMDIAAVLTKGSVIGLEVGKNCIFYDRDGQDWDAVVTKIVDNPISVSQAFWDPYRKFANWCNEKIDKFAADNESKSTAKLTASAESTQADLSAGNAKVQPQAFDVAKFAGIFAALGMGLGMIGTFLVSALKGFISLGWYIPVAIAAIVLLIS